MNGEAFLAFTLDWALVLLGIGMLCALARLLLGPTLADRVIALDMFAILVVAVISVDAIATGRSLFLRAGIVLALVAFMGTVAFAYYMERGTRRD